MAEVSIGFFELLKLQSSLRYFRYDQLGLKYLEPLRKEVDEEVERRCQKSRKEKEAEANGNS